MTKHVNDYWKKRSKPVEYKYAFGQKIPVHYQWKVKQTPVKNQDKDQEDSAKKDFINQSNTVEKVYDINGRATGDFRIIQKRPRSTFSVKPAFDSKNIQSKYKTSLSVQKDKRDSS